MADAHDRVLTEILWEPLPERRLRANPRVVKRKMSNFGVKRTAHRDWPQPTRTSKHAVRIVAPAPAGAAT